MPTCPYCKGQAKLISTPYGYRYECKPCDATVGCHPGTITALGSLANKALRQLRMDAHAAFDPIWREHKMSRNKAYNILASLFSKRKGSVHIGEMDETQCRKVISHFNSHQY